MTIVFFRCETCELFRSSGTSVTDAEYKKHLDLKDAVRKRMKKDKETAKKDKTVCTINFDLQKVLTTPRSEIGPLYYLSKLCVWNFTIFEIGSQKGYCHVWNETVGSRGSAEIASFLYNYFKKAKSGIKVFHLYSDSCGGQNRNQNVFSMCLKAAKDFQITIIYK